MRKFTKTFATICVTLALFMCMLVARPAWAAPALSDGSYTIEVSLAGGSGRASVDSPTSLTVHDGRATARITWSSPNYDYMIVDGITYQPINTEGNSCFEIPVLAFDEPFEVIGDTTAMSVPHEITYQLTFDAASAVRVEDESASWVVPVIAGGCALAITGVLLIVRRRHAG